MYLFYKDPQISFPRKIPVILLLVYALSPVNLIPDFIPILGYLDDYIIIPLGIAFCYKIIPQERLKFYEEKVEMDDFHLKEKLDFWSYYISISYNKEFV